MARVVARPYLNPEKDSEEMTCAESAEEWETNSVCLLLGHYFFRRICQSKTGFFD